MAEDFKTLSDKLSLAIAKRIQKTKSATLFVKVGLIAIGSAVVAVAQFAQFDINTGPTVWQTSGILAAIVSAIGAVFVILTEDNAAEEMAIARDAIDTTVQMQNEMSEITSVFNQLDMAIDLYSAVSIMRGTIERACVSNSLNDDTIVKMMGLASRNLTIAMDFQQSDQWTICIYRADNSESGRVQLRCLAQERAIKCAVNEARVWEEGVGVAGICYANKLELIVPDLQANEIGSMFNVGERQREHDRSRYRSIVAVPVLVDNFDRPWGVVVATSDTPGHFSAESEPGIKTSEAVRALANMVALVVAIGYDVPTPKISNEDDVPKSAAKPKFSDARRKTS